MAEAKGRKGNRLTPVLRIELSPIQELRELHSQIYKTHIKPKCNGKRNEYNMALQEIERQINISAGGEPHISLENRVDFAKFPENFNYTCKNIPGPGVKLWPDPAYIVACDCKDRCTEKSCSCPLYSGGEFAYDEYGRVTLARRRPIYECNMKCPCRKNCRNRVVQRGRRVRVCIFRTKKKGWGLKTLDYIRANEFVTEYVGEILTTEDAEIRGQKYDEMGQTYLFDLDYNEGECLYTIDAYHYGNVAHFVNHSCDPNLVVYGVWIDIVDPHLPHIALFATRDIQPGEELTFDYLMTGNTDSPPKQSSRRMKCHCKSANCREWLC